MELIVRNIESLKDYEILIALAKRLGATPVPVPSEQLEDSLLLEAIETTKKGDYVSQDRIVKRLRNIK